jgi:hypothetical protein
MLEVVERAIFAGTLLKRSPSTMSDAELTEQIAGLQTLLMTLNRDGHELAARVVERDLARLSFARRAGRFTLPATLVEGDPDLALHVLDSSLVIHCRYDRVRDAYDYVALNRAFDVMPQGIRVEFVPKYDVHVARDPDDGAITVKFVRRCVPSPT